MEEAKAVMDGVNVKLTLWKAADLLYSDVLHNMAANFVKETDNVYDDSAFVMVDGFVKGFLADQIKKAQA